MAKILFSFFLLFLILEQQRYDAATLTLDECIQLLNKEIQEDLYVSFPILTDVQDNKNYWKYTYEEIEKVMSDNEKRDRKLESLIKLFQGSSLGNKHLIILKNENVHSISDATKGYIYYKELNGTNILLEIKRHKKKWRVEKKRIGRGKYITLRDINKECMISY